MGLDHGLRKEHYVKNWDSMKPSELHQVTVLKGGYPDSNIKSERIETVIEEVITWRKANHIHNWFVTNVQGGVDDCRPANVSVSELELLVETCKAVLAASKLKRGRVRTGSVFSDGKITEQYEDGLVVEDSSVAEELLPTAAGFFFGSTQYDSGYVEDVLDTLEMLERGLALANEDDASYEYWSSW